MQESFHASRPRTVTARDTMNLLAVFALITKCHTQLFLSGLFSFLSYNLLLVAGLMITESGLPGVLFSMLDTETDNRLIKDIHDTLTSMLQMMAADNLSQWLSLCKDVLTVATGQALLQILRCVQHAFSFELEHFFSRMYRSMIHCVLGTGSVPVFNLVPKHLSLHDNYLNCI